jgi:hypothetical protein
VAVGVRVELFISYRREDTAGYALGLRRELQRHLPQARIFLDVESINVGARWRDAISERVSRSELMLVIIGDEWLERRDGIRRIHDVTDPVRVELAAALAREIHVIPVLVEEAKMPAPEELPEDIRELCEWNALWIHDRSFDADVANLVAAVSTLLDDRVEARRSSSAKSQQQPLVATARDSQREYPSRITERWLQEVVPKLGREELVGLILELKDRGWDEKSIYDDALLSSPLRPARKLPSEIVPQWLELNVPLMSVAQTRRLMDELRRRRWSEEDIEANVLAHHPSAPDDAIPSRIYPQWLQENASLMTTAQQQRLASVLRERGWDDREITRYLPLGA